MINKIIEKVGNSSDLVIRKLDIGMNTINVLFFETLSDSSNINDFVLEYFSYLKINKKTFLSLSNYIKEYTPNFKIKDINSLEEILKHLFMGFAVIIIDNKYYALEFRKQLDGGIQEAKNEKTIKGPKDSFTENYQTNVGLIRKRIRNENLWLEEVYVGEKSNTKIGIMYINDIVDISLVNEIRDKLNRIDIDAIMDSSYIHNYIKNNKSIFPNVLSTERPDLVSFKLLNGKIALVVDNSPQVLLLPAFFIEFFHTMDDYYQSSKSTTYVRIIRIIAFIITIMFPAIYIALVSYNHEIIPPPLLVNFAIQKEGVPFPTVLEAIILAFTFEILRETDVRTPTTLGSALSIVGALVLGDAAVQAGLVSPIMVIVVAITAISEMIFSMSDVSSAIKIWRLIFLFLASISGMIGVFLSIILLICELCSISSFGYPYIYPTSPYNRIDQNNAIILTNKYKLTKRNKLTAIKNFIRGKYEN